MTFKLLAEKEQRLVLRTLEVLPKMTTLCLIEGLTDEDKAAVRIAVQVLLHSINRATGAISDDEYTALGFLIRELE